MLRQNHRSTGFTIVELLIVIVVIAILAAISTIAYQGFAQRARESVVKQDLENAHKEIGMHQATNGFLPLASNCPSLASTEICLTASEGTVFTYLPNDPVAPTSYQLLAVNGSASYVYDGSSMESSYGSRFVTLTNMAQNGDFSAGQAGWTRHCQGASQCVFGEGVLTIAADPSGRSDVRQRFYATYTDGDEIFYSVRVRKDSGSGFYVGAYRDFGGFVKYILTSDQFDDVPTGQFIRHSGTRTFVASQGTHTSLHIGPSSGNRTYQIVADDVVVINLTASFGTGNEPSVAEMDGILSQFEDGYFSGTVSATY